VGIDYNLLAKNVSAVMIRTGQSTFEDTEFRKHYAGARAAKIPIGLWHFLQPDTPAQGQVDSFLKIYNSLPHKPKVIALDVENIQYFDVSLGKNINVMPPSRDFAHRETLKWCKDVRAATGGKVGIYTRKNYFEQWMTSTPDWYQFWMWIAAWYQYTGQVPPALPWSWPEYKLHQYAGGGQGTPGVDPISTCKEYFNGTHAECMAFFEPEFAESPPVVVPTDHEARITAIENYLMGLPKFVKG
jgi:GH25 family lysozyme M1 (1,4-beta-N-acetylmuramidase)